MDRLWAPWRLAYVEASKPPVGADPCFICRGLGEKNDKENLIALRSSHCVVYLNRFPYNNGHLLVAPRAHKGQLNDLSDEELLQSSKILARMISALDAIMQPQGYNIGLNLGLAAGAGLPGHLHWHIVPRWNGDTNFMPVLGDSKVLPQSLVALYDLLAGQLGTGASEDAN
jgi:ATP adenylyltransferase